jgi:hypothetical protein
MTPFLGGAAGIPLTLGQIHYVAPSTSYTVAGPKKGGRTYTASDGNDGTDPRSALTSIGQAVTNATANAGDVIALLPGTHTQTSSVALSKAGLTIIGLPYFPVTAGDHAPRSIRPQATITTSAADEAINVTAADTTIMNVRFLPVTQQKALDWSAAAARLRIVDCMVDLTSATAHANTRGLFATAAAADVHVDRCVFKESNAGTTNGAALDLGAAVNFLVSNCFVVKDFLASSVAWTSAIVVASGCTGRFVNNVVTAYGGAAGDAITNFVLGAALSNAAVVLFERNIAGVNVTKFAEDFAAADCDLANNYVATVAGGTGGTLITATT